LAVPPLRSKDLHTVVTLSRTGLVALISLVLLLSLVPESAFAKKGRPDRFHSGKVYRGSFPDPDVIRVKRHWIAAGTTVARRSLPMLTSVNGRKWRARQAHGKGVRRSNDAMVGVPRWAARHRAGKRRFVKAWAPSIGRASSGRWLAAYAAPLRRNPQKRCIGIASADRPLGPYRHHRRRPIVCPRYQGAIDPDIFRTRGRTYLLWKTSGIWGREATTIRVRQLKPNGRAFKRGTRTHTLLRTAHSWEGPLIENPSMIRHRGRLYLFYSANRWYNRSYAVGYAICRSVRGPCRRPQRGPLLSTGRGIAGPGGQSAFRGPRGKLLLAYAAWPAGRVGLERRLHVATLRVKRHGRLVVGKRFRPRVTRSGQSSSTSSPRASQVASRSTAFSCSGYSSTNACSWAATQARVTSSPPLR
jgi:beta-xylosidase